MNKRNVLLMLALFLVVLTMPYVYAQQTTDVALIFLDGVNLDVTTNGVLHPATEDFDYRFDNNGVSAGVKVVTVNGNFETLELNPDQLKQPDLNNDGFGRFSYKVVNKNANANLNAINANDNGNPEFWGKPASTSPLGIIVSRLGDTVYGTAYPDPLFYMGWREYPVDQPNNRNFYSGWSTTGKMAISFFNLGENASTSNNVNSGNNNGFDPSNYNVNDWNSRCDVTLINANPSVGTVFNTSRIINVDPFFSYRVADGQYFYVIMCEDNHLQNSRFVTDPVIVNTDMTLYGQKPMMKIYDGSSAIEISIETFSDATCYYTLNQQYIPPSSRFLYPPSRQTGPYYNYLMDAGWTAYDQTGQTTHTAILNGLEERAYRVQTHCEYDGNKYFGSYQHSQMFAVDQSGPTIRILNRMTGQDYEGEVNDVLKLALMCQDRPDTPEQKIRIGENDNVPMVFGCEETLYCVGVECEPNILLGGSTRNIEVESLDEPGQLQYLRAKLTDKGGNEYEMEVPLNIRNTEFNLPNISFCDDKTSCENIPLNINQCVRDNDSNIECNVNLGMKEVRKQQLNINYPYQNIEPNVTITDLLRDSNLSLDLLESNTTESSYEYITGVLANSAYQLKLNATNNWDINQVIKLNFVMDAPAMDIDVVSPKHSKVENQKFVVTTTPLIENLTIKTSIPAECGFTITEPKLSLEEEFEQIFTDEKFTPLDSFSHQVDVNLANFDTTLTDNGPLADIWILCKPLVDGNEGQEQYGYETLRVGWVSNPPQINLSSQPNPVIDSIIRESNLQAKINQNVICNVEKIEGKEVTIRPDYVNTFNRKNISNLVQFFKTHERTFRYGESVIGVFDEYAFNVTCTNLADLSSSNTIIVDVNLSNDPNPQIIKPSESILLENNVDIEVKTDITDTCYYTFNQEVTPNIVLNTTNKLNHTATVKLEDDEYTLRVMCNRSQTNILTHTFIVSAGEFNLFVVEPRVKNSVAPHKYAYGNQDEFLLNLSVNKPSICAYGLSSAIGFDSSNEQLLERFENWPKFDRSQNDLFSYKSDFRISSINASYSGIGTEYDYQLLQIICRQSADKINYAEINVGSDRTDPNITRFEIIPEEFSDPQGIRSTLKIDTDVRTICEVSTSFDQLNIIGPDYSTIDEFKQSHSFELEYFGDLTEINEIEFDVICESRAKRTATENMTVPVDLKEQEVKIELPGFRVRNESVQIRATTIHPDSCSYQISGDANRQGTLFSQQQDRLHTSTVNLEEGQYEIKVSCQRADSEIKPFEVALGAPDIWVVKPQGLGLRPTYAYGSTEAFDVELAILRPSTCKYSTVQSLNPISQGLSTAYEQSTQPLTTISNTRFGIEINMGDLFPGYTYTGLEKVMHVICKETDPSLVEDIYYYEPITLASTMQELAIQPIKVTPYPVIDPSNRFADLSITTNEPAICWIQTLSDEKSVSYFATDKDVYNNYDNFTTTKTNRLTFTNPEITMYDYEFGVTCESRAGKTAIRNVTVPLEITTDSAPKIIRPQRFIAENPVSILVETRIQDSCSYTFEDKEELLLYKSLTSDTGIEHRAFETLAEGDHTIHVMCGNIGSPISKSFTVDRKGPGNVNITAHEYTCSLSSFNVKLDAKDEVSGISHYEYQISIPGKEQIQGNSTSSTLTINLDSEDNQKTLTLQVSAVNTAGIKGNTSSRNIKISNSSITQCDLDDPKSFIDDKYDEANNVYDIKVLCTDNVACRPSFRYSIHTNLTAECSYAQSEKLNTTITLDQSAKFCYEVYDTNDNTDFGSKRYTITPPPPTQCYDNSGTQIVCGGDCPTCMIGTQCTSDNQCQSGNCEEGICENECVDCQKETNTCDFNSDCEQGTLCLEGSCRPQEEKDLTDQSSSPDPQEESSILSLVLMFLSLILIIAGGGLIYYDDYLKKQGGSSNKRQGGSDEPSFRSQIPELLNVKTRDTNQDVRNEVDISKKQNIDRLKQELASMKIKKRVANRNKIFDEFDDSPIIKSKPKSVIKKSKHSTKSKTKSKQTTKTDEEESYLDKLRKIAEDKDE